MRSSGQDGDEGCGCTGVVSCTLVVEPAPMCSDPWTAADLGMRPPVRNCGWLACRESSIQVPRLRTYVASSRPSCSAKSAKSLTLSVASGNPRTKQRAATQVSLTGRGRPRSWA